MYKVVIQMLMEERHNLIIDELKNKLVVFVNNLVVSANNLDRKLNASESKIRQDLYTFN